MFAIYRHAKAEAKYTATIFLNMLNDRGGPLTAKYLINADKPSDEYTALWERRFLHLTVEAVVYEGQQWHPLFTPDEIEKARDRLEKYDYFKDYKRQH